MNQPLISIIVPVYKVEQYLDQCVQSIVDQTYKNLEIILVDDGSPDNCPAMCDAWAEKDKRIKVIHKENGGLSDARNAGMKAATGEYVAFVDSDDYVHYEYINYLYLSIEQYDADIAACDILNFSENDVIEACTDNYTSAPFTVKDALETLINGHTFRAVAWNKLYKREILDNESFRVGKYHEDEFFTYKILAKASRLVFVYNKLYYYLQRDNSIMSTSSVKHLDVLDAAVERLEFLSHEFPELYHHDKVTFCIGCLNNYMSILDFNDDIISSCKTRIKKIRKKVTFDFSELITYKPREIFYITSTGRLIGLTAKLLKFKRNLCL